MRFESLPASVTSRGSNSAAGPEGSVVVTAIFGGAVIDVSIVVFAQADKLTTRTTAAPVVIEIEFLETGDLGSDKNARTGECSNSYRSAGDFDGHGAVS